MANYSDLEIEELKRESTIQRALAAVHNELRVRNASQFGSAFGDEGMNGTVGDDGKFTPFFRAGDVAGLYPVEPE
jgi:hypothetical protein